MDRRTLRDRAPENQRSPSVAHVAKVLADHYGIISEHTKYEGGFGGLCVNFRPAYEGQECPDVIDEGDEGGDWP